jgi:hypothetical protein
MKRTFTSAATVIATAGFAFGGSVMDLQVDDRITVGFGTMETLSGSFEFDSMQSEPTTLFENWTGGAGGGFDAANGFGQMSSLISNTTIFADGSTNASAFLSADKHNYVSALGSSSHTIGFSIVDTVTFSLIANLEATGEANAWARVRQGFGLGNIVYDRTVNNNSASIDLQITLGPGDYTVQFFANSSVTLFDVGSDSGSSSFDAAWSVVPAPGTAGTFAVCAVLLTKRRQG